MHINLKGGIGMPTSVIVIGTIVAAGYVLRGDVLRGILQKIIQAMQSFMGGSRQKTKPEPVKDAVEELSQDREEQQRQKDEKNVEKETEKTERETERTEEETDKQNEPEKQEIGLRQGVIDCFVPDVWMSMSPEQRQAVITALVMDVKNDMGIPGEFVINFKENSDELEPVFTDDSETRKVLEINQDFFVTSPTETDSIYLYNQIVEKLAYQRQTEIANGTIQPSPKEEALRDLVSHNLSGAVENIDMPQIYFLGKRIKELNNQTGASYINKNPQDSYEKICMSMLQPAERFPNMTRTMYHEQLKQSILQHGSMSSEVQDFMKDMDRLSFFHVRRFMNELYGCSNIEAEIDKAFQINNPLCNKQFDKVNKQVLYAVSLYQVESNAENEGVAFVDPRTKVLMSFNGSIDEMSAKQYKFNKGRLAYENIEVKEVLSDEEWDKKHPKKDKDSNKNDPQGKGSKDRNDSNKGAKERPEKPMPPNNRKDEPVSQDTPPNNNQKSSEHGEAPQEPDLSEFNGRPSETNSQDSEYFEPRTDNTDFFPDNNEQNGSDYESSDEEPEQEMSNEELHDLFSDYYEQDR